MSTLFDRVQAAIKLDPSIITTWDKITTNPTGADQNYLLVLGLDKRDLKKLERMGLAIRGYSKNVYGTGETLPDGTEVKENESFRGRGHTVRWLLVAGGSNGERNTGAVQKLPIIQSKDHDKD